MIVSPPVGPVLVSARKSWSFPDVVGIEESPSSWSMKTVASASPRNRARSRGPRRRRGGREGVRQEAEGHGQLSREEVAELVDREQARVAAVGRDELRSAGGEVEPMDLVRGVDDARAEVRVEDVRADVGEALRLVEREGVVARDRGQRSGRARGEVHLVDDAEARLAEVGVVPSSLTVTKLAKPNTGKVVMRFRTRPPDERWSRVQPS